MPSRSVSISWENGGPRRTYGVSATTSNMKFPFKCLVVLAACSVCATGDLEIFPGYKLRMPERRVASRAPAGPSGGDGGAGDPPYPRWSWPEPLRRPKDADFDFDVPLRLSQLQALNTGRPDRLAEEEEEEEVLRAYYSPRESLERAYETFRERENKAGRYRAATSSLLSDVRPYPAAEDDFSFQGEDDGPDEEEDGEEEEDDFRRARGGAMYATGAAATMGGRRYEQAKDPGRYYGYRSGEEASGGGSTAGGRRASSGGGEEASGRGALEEAKVVDDPTEFAYAPPDPRFYETSPVTESKLTKQRAEEGRTPGEERRFESTIRVIHRKDESFLQDGERGGGGGLDGRSGVSIARVEGTDGEDPDPEAVNVFFIAIVAGVSAAATVALVAVGVGWYKLQKHVRSASDADYPAYGVTGPNKDVTPSGDRKLAQSAQMYHYQHQKQQIVAMESRAAGAGDRHNSNSEPDSDEENEEGDYTVYECPGLAPTGEMEVKNPLFQDDQTPMEAPQVKIGEESQK